MMIISGQKDLWISFIVDFISTAISLTPSLVFSVKAEAEARLAVRSVESSSCNAVYSNIYIRTMQPLHLHTNNDR